MKKFVRLGNPVCPGVREIISIHTWAVRPSGIEKAGDFVEVSGEFLNVRNLALDYCRTDDGKFVKKIPIVKGLREAVRKQMPPRGLTWAALGFGYGDSFRWFNYATVRELLRIGAPVKIFSWGKGQDPGLNLPEAKIEADYRHTTMVMNARRRILPELYRKFQRNAHALLGYFQCEGTLVANHLLDFHKHFDAMLATSEATKKAIEDSKIGVPVHVFGHGIDPTQFQLMSRPLGRKPYTFFHFADVQSRKGTDVLLKAFKAVRRQDVRLYIKAQWENPESKGYRKDMSDNRVVWDFKRYSPEELPNLLAKMDCGVFPSRAEGFGLPKLECEATGMPTIATNAFGYKDTSVEDGTILLNVKEWIPTKIDSGNCAEPDAEHLTALMEKCAEDQSWAASRGRVAGANAHAKWKWSDKIEELLKILEIYGFEMTSSKQPA